MGDWAQRSGHDKESSLKVLKARSALDNGGYYAAVRRLVNR